MTHDSRVYAYNNAHCVNILLVNMFTMVVFVYTGFHPMMQCLVYIHAIHIISLNMISHKRNTFVAYKIISSKCAHNVVQWRMRKNGTYLPIYNHVSKLPIPGTPCHISDCLVAIFRLDNITSHIFHLK